MKLKKELTIGQRERLQKLWFEYGNGGRRSTLGNHRFIQDLIAHGEDNRQFYIDGAANMRERGLTEGQVNERKLTQECVEAVDAILKEEGK